MDKIYIYIELLINYSLKNNLIDTEDKIFCINNILSILKLNEWKVPDKKENIIILESIEDILDKITNWAIEQGLIENTLGEKELLDTKIIGILTPKPSEVIKKFNMDYKISPEKATNNFYKFSKITNYIREKRIAKNLHWISQTDYGDMEITVNLAKPEKDPKDIEKEKNFPKSSYPKCLLCIENVGYSGNINHPARQNHRIIPLNLKEERWNFQYSPYVYYNEHSIIFSNEHRPMKISKLTFERILDFLEQMPHYFIGSNADLPIVGGSILSHDHYQGGNHEFPMAKSQIEYEFTMKNFPEINCGIVKWPMSVIRLKGSNKIRMAEAAEYILDKWKEYMDEDVNIRAYTDEIPHNTITPIGRKKENYFEIDLVLRNNRTTNEFPMGIFHPHQEVHNIKKENIGLIEVMGLAVLPGRLNEELNSILKIYSDETWEEKLKADSSLVKHSDWIKNLKNKYQELDENILKKEVGNIFLQVLEDSGVFKRDFNGKKAFLKFISTL